MGRLMRWLGGILALLLAFPLLLGMLFLTVVVPSGPVLGATCGTTTAAGGWMIPFRQAYTVTSEYGWRKHPVTGFWKLHTGIDLAAATKPGRVVAAGPGTVTTAGAMGGYGNAVVVDHGGGISTLYGHLASIDPAVGVGTVVTGGTALGIGRASCRERVSNCV